MVNNSSSNNNSTSSNSGFGSTSNHIQSGTTNYNRSPSSIDECINNINECVESKLFTMPNELGQKIEVSESPNSSPSIGFGNDIELIDFNSLDRNNSSNNFYEEDDDNEIHYSRGSSSKKNKFTRYCRLVENDNLESETDQTVLIPQEEGFSFKKLLGFIGPSWFISIGYMDPGNWATDLQGGSQFGYRLLWVLLLSNVMALLLQYLSFKVALVTHKDLASLCKSQFPKKLNILLWIICEIAITATDLAEVIGTAIALNMFGVPLIAAVLITGFDTLLFLYIQKWGIRKLEIVILGLLTAITLCFVVELFYAKPDAKSVFKGFIPTLTKESVVVATSIIGATVMPHNLFLHSGVVKSRKVEKSSSSIKQAIKYNLFDTIIALNSAFFVNASILMLSAAVFYENNIQVDELQDASKLLGDLVGTKTASIIFGIGLLCAGQASTITGTMAGQIVMEGFIDLKILPWIRRLATRALAILPAIIVILSMGEEKTYTLLIFSQVILSLGLPFAVIPLIQFTADESIMGEFKNSKLVVVASWLITLFILSLNFMTVIEIVQSLLEGSLALKILAIGLFIPIIIFLLLLLIWIVVYKRIHSIKETICSYFPRL